MKENLTVKIFNCLDDTTYDFGDMMFLIFDTFGLLEETNHKDTPVVFIQNYNGTQEEKAKTISDFVSLYEGKNVAIVSWAYVSTEEFSEEKYYDPYEAHHEDDISKKIPIPYEEVIERESKLLESVGFININNFCNYEFAKVYIYSNQIGKEIVKLIDEKLTEFIMNIEVCKHGL